MAKELKKEISKLSKIPHPKGRKTAKLAKKATRLEHRQKTKLAQTMRTNISAEKYLYFKEQLISADSCSPSRILGAVNNYLSRFNEELQQINLKREIGGKRGRQHANREDIIKMTIDNELEEFNTCGIELPDVLNPKQFQLLKTWKGELRFLQNFKLTRFNKTKLMNLIEKEESKLMDTKASTDEAMKANEVSTGQELVSPINVQPRTETTMVCD